MNGKTFLAVGAAALLSACGTGTGNETTSLSARVGAPTSTGSVAQALELGNGLQLDRVRMVVREIELDFVDTADGRDGAKIEKGPFLIDLSGEQLTGGVIALLATEIPAGEYEEIEFKIERLRSHELATATPELQAMGNASVILNGTFNGAPFEFKSAVDFDQDYEGRFVIAPGVENNVTLNINPTTWFVGRNAELLDPSVEANRPTIENNIEGSIDACKDDDKDGHKDDDKDDDRDSDSDSDSKGGKGKGKGSKK